MARPERAPAALAIASIVVTCTYLAIGVGGAALFWRAGVKQLILLNLDASTLIAQVVYVCSATVAVLSVGRQRAQPFTTTQALCCRPGLMAAHLTHHRVTRCLSSSSRWWLS